MIRNPIVTDNDGVPCCFGRCDETLTICSEDCPNDLFERCQVETSKDNERIPNKENDITGRPECYANMYSENSAVCEDECKHRDDFKKEKSPFWLKQAKEDVKEDTKRYSLPVLQDRPAVSVIDPPSKPVNYWQGQYRPYSQPTTYPQSTNYQASNNYQLQVNKPTLSQEDFLEFYNAVPARNALVPGQFEGESWYSRLAKEWILRSLQYAIQVAGGLLVEMVSRIRWSPK